MAIKLANPSNLSGKSSVIDGPGELGITRNIYQQLGSLVKAKNILGSYMEEDTVDPDGNQSLYLDKMSNEFRQFLDELDSLFTDGDLHDDTTIAANEYLGSLGIDKSYPYSKDFVDIPQWIDSGTVSILRNVVSGDNNVVYSDPNSGEQYNVIYDA